MNGTQTGAVILCGGASRRMGRDKAALTLEGRSFLDRLIRALSDFPELLLAVGEGADGMAHGLPAVPDVYPGCGPMAGLHAALSACASPALLAVPCDLPLFTAALGAHLCGSLRPDDDALIVRTRDGGLHPTCGVYRKSAAQVMEACLAAGDYSIRRALARMRVHELDLSATPFPDALLTNINTPEDYRRLIGAMAQPDTGAGGKPCAG